MNQVLEDWLDGHSSHYNPSAIRAAEDALAR